MAHAHLLSQVLHLFQMFILLFQLLGVRGQTPEIIQTPETLSVSAGEEFTLNCILKGSGRPGGVRWYRGPDRNQPAIYTQKDASPRVMRLGPESPTDFSITISNVRPEDAGTYYCVKYKKTSGTEVEETAGKGTVVSVIDVRGQTPEIIQTLETLSVSAGEEFTLNCILKGSGRPGEVRWYRGPDRNQPAIYTQRNASPRVTRLVPESPTDFSITISNVQLEDAGTYYCVKYKKTSGTEVEETAGKGTVVSVIVPPTVQVGIKPPPPAHLNGTVTLTCNMKDFYPNDIKVVWFENYKIEMGTNEPMINNSIGLFSLKNSLVVRATEEKNMSIFTCLVRHNSQPPVNQTATLIIQPYARGNYKAGGLEDQLVHSISYPFGLWVGLFLSKIITGFFLLFLFLRKERSKTTPRDQDKSGR